MKKSYLLIGSALGVFSIFLILAWIDPVLVPWFHSLPQVARLCIYGFLGAVFGYLVAHSFKEFLSRRV